jgi:hypothetical protein
VRRRRRAPEDEVSGGCVDASPAGATVEISENEQAKHEQDGESAGDQSRQRLADGAGSRVRGSPEPGARDDGRQRQEEGVVGTGVSRGEEKARAEKRGDEERRIRHSGGSIAGGVPPRQTSKPCERRREQHERHDTDERRKQGKGLFQGRRRPERQKRRGRQHGDRDPICRSRCARASVRGARRRGRDREQGRDQCEEDDHERQLGQTKAWPV